MSDEAADGLAEIRSYNRQRGPQCTIGIALSAMEPTLRQTVQKALEDPTIERSAIVRWLSKRHGIDISPWSFRNHVNGQCRCE